jgi:Mg2+ and Co2+ transporter CorA
MSDQYRKESDSSSSARNSGIKDKIVGKISSTTGNLQEDNNVNLSESARVSNNVRTVILALFALIGFIILVFAVFTVMWGVN